MCPLRVAVRHELFEKNSVAAQCTNITFPRPVYYSRIEPAQLANPRRLWDIGGCRVSFLQATVSVFVSIVPLLLAFSKLSFLSMDCWLTLFQAFEGEHSNVTDMWCKDLYIPVTGRYVRCSSGMNLRVDLTTREDIAMSDCGYRHMPNQFLPNHSSHLYWLLFPTQINNQQGLLRCLCWYDWDISTIALQMPSLYALNQQSP